VNAVFVNNSMHLGLAAARDGIGLAWMGADLVRPLVESGALIQVLEDWCPTFAGYHLYYPSRMHPSPAFSVLVDALRYRG